MNGGRKGGREGGRDGVVRTDDGFYDARGQDSLVGRVQAGQLGWHLNREEGREEGREGK